MVKKGVVSNGASVWTAPASVRIILLCVSGFVAAALIN